ncbi:MAG: hypothetical protein HXY19_09080 [Thermoanaerobaculaceae bacterium]|nr:hypothetical protein [Thermoanaerobaculaceae bacterium]
MKNTGNRWKGGVSAELSRPLVGLAVVLVLLLAGDRAGAQVCPSHLLNWTTLPAGYVGEQECTFLVNCNNPPLQPTPPAHCCNDGQDNDGDGLTDASDPDCQHEYLCQDGIDNDGDGAADGADLDCGCLGDVTGFTGCTANDTKIVLIGLGQQSDGCVTGTDSQTIWLGAQVTTTATTRYDLGAFIHLDGLTTLTGLCSRRALQPVSTLNGPYQPATGYGLFDNEDGDKCGEVRSTDPQTLYYWTFPITTPCVPSSDGFLSMGRCGAWDNNANTTCNGFWDALPGTSSKCRCEETATNIPAPALSLACSTDRTEARPGWSVNYTITYTNSCTCTPDSRPENIRCCTAAYVRFPFSYSRGTISNIKIDNVTVTLPDPRVIDTFDPGTRVGTLVWNPQSAAGTLNIIEGGTPGTPPVPNTHTLTFTFTVDPDAPSGSLANATATEWANDSAFTNAVTQPLASSCPITVNPTYATVNDVALANDGGVATLSWKTSAEVGVVGFNVYRLDEGTGEYLKVNPYLLPALSGGGGASYRFVDPTAPLGKALTYRIGEREFRGGETMHGPFTLTPAWRVQPAEASYDESGFAFSPRPPSPRVAAAKRSTAPRRIDSLPAAAGAEKVATSVGAKVSVGAAGLYAVTADEIAGALGSPLAKVQNAIKNGQLALSTGGRSVAWQGAADGSRLWFVGETIDSPFTATNVYVIREGRGKVMTAATVTAAPPAPAGAWFTDTVHFEKDLLPRVYLGFAANEDFWYWDFVMSENPSYAQKSLPFTLDGVAAAAGSARLELSMSSVSETPASPDCHAAVAVNGHPVGEAMWDGLSLYTASFTFPASYLRDGANTLSVRGIRGTLMIEAFDVTFPRLYRAQGDVLRLRGGTNAAVTVSGFTSGEVRLLDVSEPTLPRVVSGFATALAPDGSYQISFKPAAPGTVYLAVGAGGMKLPVTVRADRASDLQNKQNRGEYLAIAESSLLAGAQALAQYREGTGLTTMVVDLEDVYDEFSFGIPDPEAVRRFVRAAVAGWRTAPRFLAIVGKGSFDYRNNLGLGGNLFPPIMTPTTYGLFAADPLFGDVDGDGVAEVAVGRIPAVSVAEVEDYVAKLAAYESAGAEAWTGRVFLLADNADYAGDFPTDSAALAGGLPAGLAVTAVSLGAPYSAPEARTRALQAMGEGVLLFSYVGHAGVDRLAAEGLVLASDAAAMSNAPRLPVVAGLTCYVNLFAHPGLSSIGEELLLAPSGGAVAVWAPSGLAVNATSIQLGRYFLASFFAGGTTVGEKVGSALREFVANGGDGEHARIYTLLGDPAAVVRRSAR